MKPLIYQVFTRLYGNRNLTRKENGSLAQLIDRADKMSAGQTEDLGNRARQRIMDEYSWEKICDRYAAVFTMEHDS